MLHDDGLRTPLRCALQQYPLPVETARCLVAAGPASEALQTMSESLHMRYDWQAALPLYADLVAAHTPLAEAEWALVPAPCPGLGAALLAVLQRSAAQAARLVAHMPAGDVRRLRTAALCLARAQRAHDAPLPQPLVWRVLSLCLAP